MIYECDANHISFSKDNLIYCGMKGCSKPVSAKSSVDIEWFYKINPAGLVINSSDLHKILDDKNMPQEVKETVKELFADSLAKKGTRKWFRIKTDWPRQARKEEGKQACNTSLIIP